MLVVGLTGSIGSGKSFVASLFAKHGVPIIDTDHIAKSCITPGSEIENKIIAQLGNEILSDQKILDRRLLREWIFTHPADKQWLEKLLHPLVRAQVKVQVEAIQAPYCIVVIPLLIENLPNPIIDRILVVDAPLALQIERTMKRDHCSKAQVQAILKTQASRDERLSHADDIIHNESDLESLTLQVNTLHEQYMKLNK